MRVEDCKAYEVIEARPIDDLKSMSYLLKHKKTGARIALLSNDDENKVFYIGFRTPPEDSTGVAHIVEHTVLCGSREFPVKDPFIELAKGSLNTFLNAMTYPDKTVYPVASCNDKDFQNLMHVYLDAVFYPNIYREEKIFRQEGWHYELENPEDELKLNGVVYSEMKGAFSSPDDVFEREIMNSLFPDTTYGVESGGDPDVIPELSYEQFLDFHRRYYHPSNSYIYLYGDMDMAEKLNWMDEHYLSQFDALEIDSTIKEQKTFDETRRLYKTYPIAEGESTEENTYLAWNAVTGGALDGELSLAFQMLEYAICGAQGAPLKLALMEKQIGKDVYSSYMTGIAQPYFSVVAKNCEESDEAEFLATIREVLEEMVQKGIDKKTLEASLNTLEFRYREADFGRYPKGLMYGLNLFDSWLYDETKPFIQIEANAYYRSLREKIQTDYFEQLIRKYLLEGTHKSIVVVAPEAGLATKKEEALKAKLQSYKESLSIEEIQAIVDNTAALRAYQEEESSEEELARIPMLKREDMKREAMKPIYELRKSGEDDILFHNIYTNGIQYFRVMFDITDIPEELLPYAGLLRNIIGSVDTEQYSYKDLESEINLQVGGFEVVIDLFENPERFDHTKLYFCVGAKMFYPKTAKTMELLTELMLRSDYTDTKRLKEILEEMKSKRQASMMSAGHSLAAWRACSYFSEKCVLNETLNGLDAYRRLEELLAHYDERKEDLVHKLQKAAEYIFRKDNMMFDITADEEGYRLVADSVAPLRTMLPNRPYESQILHLQPIKKNEGLMNSSQIQYVAMAGDFAAKGLQYNGAIRVLQVIMSYDYLWNNVRVKGGAYGCMNAYNRYGLAYFVSYRDPNLTNTIDVFRKAADYIRNLQLDERSLTKYIIGAVADMDTPMNPDAKGRYGLNAYFNQIDFAEIQRARDEALDVTNETINQLADIIEAFISDDCICVVGNEKTIKENKDLFMTVENLFH